MVILCVAKSHTSSITCSYGQKKCVIKTINLKMATEDGADWINTHRHSEEVNESGKSGN